MTVERRAHLLYCECFLAWDGPGIPLGFPPDRGPDPGLRLLEDGKLWEVQQNRYGAHHRFRLQSEGQPTDN